MPESLLYNELEKLEMELNQCGLDINIWDLSIEELYDLITNYWICDGEE